ncbi:methylase [Spirochaetia bacterium]|nr:methylase [Spirochaetia bacterium]
MKSPLRYPGSKAAFAPVFFDITSGMHNATETLIEPFAGSAALSLYALENNLCSKVILIERDPLLYGFWESAFNHTQELVQKIEQVEITIGTWLNLNQYRLFDKPDMNQLVDLGFSGLFFNRTNFSGIIGSTPIGGMEQNSNYKINCRFNKKEIIKSIQNIAQFKDNVTVIFGNAVDEIIKYSKEKTNLFFFIDPPYYKQGQKLYRYSYTVADHLNLSSILKNVAQPFFLTYDKHHVIEYLYKDLYIHNFNNRYTTRVPKMGNELLISNREFCNNCILTTNTTP